MDVVTFLENFSISVINDPLLQLASTNSGRYRIYVRFLKDIEKWKMPIFGTCTLNERHGYNIHHLPFYEIQHACLDIPLKDEPTYQGFIERGASAGEFMIFDFCFKDKAELTMLVRARMMAMNKIRSNWTLWLETEVSPTVRLCFMMGQNDFEVWDSKNFDNYILGLENRCNRRNHHCCVCIGTVPLSDVLFQDCGHGLCSGCFRKVEKCPSCLKPRTEEWRARNRLTPCPIDGCHQPYEGNHYMVIPCGCLITHNFTKKEKEQMSGQYCPYKMCRLGINHVKKIFISREHSGRDEDRY